MVKIFHGFAKRLANRLITTGMFLIESKHGRVADLGAQFITAGSWVTLNWGMTKFEREEFDKTMDEMYEKILKALEDGESIPELENDTSPEFDRRAANDFIASKWRN